MGNSIGTNKINTMNLYIGMFCLLYSSIFFINGKTQEWRAAFSAIIILSLILFMNVMFILAIFFRPINSLITFIVFVTLFIINYLLFLRVKRYEISIELYKKTNTGFKWLVGLILFGLVLLSILLGYIELRLKNY
jgi:hypothetical protein